MRKFTQLDPNQIVTRLFDEESDAQRVILVGDSRVEDISGAIRDALKDIKVELNSSQEQMIMPNHLQVISVPEIVRETQIVHVPQIVKETEVITIEKPIITKEIQVITIEKPVVVTEVKIIEVEKQVIVKELSPFPIYLKIAFIIQTLAMVAQVIFHK